MYFGSDNEIEGCLSAATAIISMDVQLDTPDNHKYEQSYIAGDSDVMKQTDDSHGQSGYEVELDIDSYTTGFAYSMRSLGEYE
jgi:hypothetical protein